MIEQIRELAAPSFRPCTQRVVVTEVIKADGITLLDCEPKLPQIITVVEGGRAKLREATEAELSTILEWLKSHPQHPETLSPMECLERFTDAEQDSIEQHYPRFARQLFAATADIPWERYSTAVEALTTTGILSEESRTRHLGARQ